MPHENQHHTPTTATPTATPTATRATSTTTTRLAVVALDAADADLLCEGMDAGELPNLARLRDAGRWGYVAGPKGFGSGASWVSFATGTTPARHGRYFFRRVLPGSYAAQHYEGSEFTVPTFMELLSEHGRRVAVFDLPCVPVLPGLNGISVADWLTHDLVYQELRTSPPQLAAELSGRFGGNPMWKCDRPGGRTLDEHRELYELLLGRIDQRIAGTRHYLEQGPWDLFVTTFSESHCVGHQCWHLHDPRHALHRERAGQLADFDPVTGVYRKIDEGIGELMAALGSEANLIVFTATGMGPNYTGNMILDDVLRARDGVRPTRAVSAMAAAKSLAKRHLPTSIRHRYASLNRKVDERVRTDDRARRPSFAVPHNDLSGAIRLNIVGREASGVLHPGDEVDRYVEELRRDLLDLRNLDTGRPIVREVVRVADEIQGDALDELPDLFVTWERDTFPDRVGSDRIGEVTLPHRGNRTGDHLPHNLFLAVGPGVTPGRVDGNSIVDFAPTIAAMLGVAMDGVDGRVMPGFTVAPRLAPTAAS